jgi:hypothetical protein
MVLKKSIRLFRIENYFTYPPVLVPSILGGGSFTVLMISLILISYKGYEGKKLWVYEVIRFICISGISMSPILLFIITDVGIGMNSPMGLIMDQPLDENKVHWVIHIGGTQNDNYATGLIIPFFVFAFGILGGYLRYLYKAFEKMRDEEKEEESKKYIILYAPDIDNITSAQFLHDTIGELTIIFLSPLLAIAVWFILFQGDISDNIYIAAAISFTLGLVTREVIEGLIAFASGRFPKRGTD